MATAKQVGEIVTKLRAAFPEFKPADPGATVQVYADALRDVPIKALEIAANTWIQNEKWFPKISELRSHAKFGKKGQWLTEPEGFKDLQISNLLQSRLQPDIPFCRAIERFEELRPSEWKPEDYQEFASIMGRPVNFEKDPQDAPWMWWTKPQE